MKPTTTTTTEHHTSILAVAIAAVIGFVWLYWSKKREDPGQPRKWSFTSQGIALGSFPERANYPDPIIHVVLFMDPCPTVEELIEKVVAKMLVYERLSGVFDARTGRILPCPDLDPHDMVRLVEFEGGADQDFLAQTEELIHNPLSEGARGKLLPW
jgi:hypothetical protein